jgi:hypothetical protein
MLQFFLGKSGTIQTTTASIAGAGSVSASASYTFVATASIAGVGSVSATASSGGVSTTTASISGTGTVSAAGYYVASTSASIAGVGSVASTASYTRVTTASIAGAGSVAAAAAYGKTTTAAVSGSGSVSAAASSTSFTAASIAGVGSILAFGSTAGTAPTSGGFRLGGAVAQPGGAFGQDSFAGTSGALISSRPADPYGGSWSTHPSYSGTSVLSAAGMARPGTLAKSLYLFSKTTSVADYTVQATVSVKNYGGAGNGYTGVAIRYNPSVDSGYVGRLYYDFGADLLYWQICRVSAGTTTVLASTQAILVTGGSATFAISASGNSLRLLVNGVQTLSVTDSSFASAGSSGVLFQTTWTSPSDLRDFHIDAWSAGDSLYAVAAYSPPTSGGFRLGGTPLSQAVNQGGATGGFRMGGATAPAKKANPAISGGFRLGGAPAITSNRNLSVSGTGGFRLGGRAAPSYASTGGQSGGFEIGGSTPFIYVALPRVSGGFRFGGVSEPSGSRRYSISTAGGFRIGGVAVPASSWGVPSSGGFRLGGRFLGYYTYPEAATGGFRLGGGKLPKDYRLDGIGGFRLGGGARQAGLIYRVYQNDGEGGPVDYSAPIIETPYLWCNVPAIPYPGDYTWHVRVYDASSGLEERNIDGRVRLVLDASGVDITSLPASPSTVSCQTLSAGRIRVSWAYRTPSGRTQPSEFRVYGGTPVVSYAAPVAVVRYAGDRSYWADIPSLTHGRPYQFVVRAANAAAEEANTLFAEATPDSVGPRPVDSLQLTAV